MLFKSATFAKLQMQMLDNFVHFWWFQSTAYCSTQQAANLVSWWVL